MIILFGFSIKYVSNCNLTKPYIKNMSEFIKPYNNDPFVGNLSTPVTTSTATKLYLGNLPIYRKGLSSLMRGVEIGMAHGYFFVGPFTKLGPLRNAEIANLAGFLSAAGLICILKRRLLTNELIITTIKYI